MRNILKIKNPSTGEFEPIAAISGADGKPGKDGKGVPTGGTVGQVLKKTGSGDYETGWSDSAGDSEKLGGVAAAQYALKNDVPAYNLLDNSDFRNPVAQAGIGGKHGGKTYVCDRWYDTYGYGTYSLNEGVGITLSYGTNHCYCVQKINNASQYYGKTMTLAIQLSNGTIYVNSGTYLSSSISLKISGDNWEYDLFYDRVELVVVSDSITVSWIALYEGSYDTSTLPPYVPKGKHVEMLNCGISLTPHNLLDNSYFTNPVNQRGITSQIGGGYGLDRWRADGSGTISVESNGISLTNLSFRQPVPLKAGTYTLAFHLSDGRTLGYVFKFDGSSALNAINSSWNETTGAYVNYYKQSTGVVMVQIVVAEGYTIIVDWAALYEGSYDASTLPAYQPKGYAAELAECRRYYQQISLGNGYFVARSVNDTSARSMIYVPQMRIIPSITSDTALSLASSNGTYYSITNMAVYNPGSNSYNIAFTSSGLTARELYALHATTSTGNVPVLSLSADL